MKVAPLTDFLERFDPDRTVYLGTSLHTIESSQWHKGQVRIEISGIETSEEVEELRWRYLTVPASERPALEEDEYLTVELIGLKVVESGKEIGVVNNVIRSAVNDLLEVDGVLIPAVAQFVKRVDVAGGVVEVELIDGMRPGDQTEEAR